MGGLLINPVTYRKNIAYVMQDDFLMATATPREALTFSAKLRLPEHFTAQQITDKVNFLITALGIEDCADTITGGVLMKGISGGQRKRTSVGIELITDPTVSILDLLNIVVMSLLLVIIFRRTYHWIGFLLCLKPDEVIKIFSHTLRHSFNYSSTIFTNLLFI